MNQSSTSSNRKGRRSRDPRDPPTESMSPQHPSSLPQSASSSSPSYPMVNHVTESHFRSTNLPQAISRPDYSAEPFLYHTPGSAVPSTPTQAQHPAIRSSTQSHHHYIASPRSAFPRYQVQPNASQPMSPSSSTHPNESQHSPQASPNRSRNVLSYPQLLQEALHKYGHRTTQWKMLLEHRQGENGYELHRATFFLRGRTIVSSQWQRDKVAARQEAAFHALPLVNQCHKG